MEEGICIGIPNAQGNTVLRRVPEQIRLTQPNAQGETLVLDRYTGPVFDTPHGKLQWGDYFTHGLHVTVRWLCEHPTEWEKVR